MINRWNVAGFGLIAAIAVHWAMNYQVQWELGPKYGMPVSLLAPDGKHFADGEPLDPFTMIILRNDIEEEVWLAVIAMAGVTLVLLVKISGQLRRGPMVQMSNGQAISFSEGGVK